MKVIVFNAPNFQGERQELSIGKHNIAALKDGIGNDALRSLLITDGLKVQLFKHSDFKAAMSALDKDAPAVTGGDRSTSSIVIEMKSGYHYQLSGKHCDLPIGVKGSSTDSDTVLAQEEFTGEDNQQYEFFALEDGSYKIVARHSKKVLGLRGGSSSNHTRIVQQDWKDEDHQKWLLTALDDGTFHICSKKAEGQVMDIGGASKTVGAELLLYSKHGRDNQRFHLKRVVNQTLADELFPKTDEAYTIITEHSGKPIGVKSFSTEAGAQIEQQSPNPNENTQLFKFIPIGNDVYRIQNAGNGLYLGLPSDRKENGESLLVDEWKGEISQMWKLTFHRNGNFIFTVLHSGRVMDLSGWKMQDGARIHQWDLHEGTNQQFRLEPKPLTLKLEIAQPAAVCAPGTVDLTSDAVITARDKGTLSYAKDESFENSLTHPSHVRESGTYYIKLTAADGRTAVSPVTVTIHPEPILEVSPHISICWDQTADLTQAVKRPEQKAEQGISLSDQNTDQPSEEITYFEDSKAKQIVADPKNAPAGTYYIQLKNEYGCSVIETVQVKQKKKPLLQVANPPTVCWDQKVNLKAKGVITAQGPGEVAYFKDEATTTPVDDPMEVEAGDYFIQLKTTDGCKVVEKVSATVHPKPNLVVHNPQPVCGITSYNLKAPEVTAESDPGTLSYFEDENLTKKLEKPEAVGAGTFYIQLKTEKGCTVSAPVTTKIYPIPELALEEPAPVCNGFTFGLLKTVITPLEDSDKLEYAGADQKFAPLATDTLVKAGTYQIRRTNQFGCSTTAEVEVREHPVPRLRLQETEWAYRPETIDLTAPYLTAGSDEGTLSYFKDNPQSAISEEEAKSAGEGTYYIQLTSPHGCKSEPQKITTTLKDRPSIAVPIHVDARYVETTEICASPRLDFSRLPYYDGERDINPYTPYLGEELEAVPFKNGEFELEKGLHLHWALPDFLTKSFRYPMLDLSALRRAARTNRLGEPGGQLYDELFDLFVQENWIRVIPDNSAYASILAEQEKVDITISELLGSTDTKQKALGQEVLRVRSLLEPGGTQMPPVPNRWRVIRTGGGEATKDWTVESDFLRHADHGDYQTGVPFPHPNPQPEQPPYGWLGRKYGTGHGKPKEDKGSYLDMPLTTLGYGDATFAAFYPNCHSVFGLHDEEATPDKEYTYEIYGYYAEENRPYEYFDLQRRDVINRTASLPERRQVLFELLKSRFGLEVEDTAPGVWPDRLVCCGKIHVKASKAAENQQPDITVTVGSTSTEAVSAFLANRISGNKKLEVEEYLESLQYLKRLEHLKTDIGPKLLEERHRQSFTSDKGGYRWVLVPKNKTAEEVGKQIEQVVLTDDKAHFLHELNELQLAFDRTDAQIKSLRRQIFADWSKYMLCQYPPDGADDEYPDADQARFFIEFELMPWLEELNGKRQELAKGIRSHIQSFWHFQPGDIQSPAGLYQAMMAIPKLKPLLDQVPQAAGNAAALARVLNLYIDHNDYHQEGLPPDGTTDAPKLSIDEILDQQRYQHHLIRNRMELEANFPGFLTKHPDTILRRKPHRPFHRPTDPVVMVTGDALKTTRKHGQDGQLPHTLEVVKGLTGLLELASKSTKGNTNIVPKDWQEVPGRHPLLLDWLVEFFPVEDTDFNLDSYEPDYLLDKYKLEINQADLKATKDDLYAGVGHSFWGSSILASSGSKTLKQSLETFLISELQLTASDLEDIEVRREAFSNEEPWIKKYGQLVTADNFDAFYGWTPEEIAPADLKELWAAKHKMLALLAYEQVQETHFLAQAMGGFTPALMMMREGYQLKIADPLGYPEYQEFSRKVNEAVGLMNHASTLPNNPFFPIRAGAASILELRLIDTFGQEIVHIKDLLSEGSPEVIAAETLLPQHSHHHFELTPRLSQASRLNFHWLSAVDDQVEHNEHPASSPICGWVLLNHMDKSLMVYDQLGKALGYIDREGEWRSTPGQRPGILAEGIRNWHLRRMVLWLMKKAKQGIDPNDGQSDTIPHFMALVQDALKHVEPPRGDHAGEGVAMLMSRPLALVRATASIELNGLPAVNQSWAEFRKIIESPMGDRESSLDIENVALPLRIGEDHQLNDGLVGFWEDAEDGEAYRDDAFRLPSLHRATDGNREYTDQHMLDILTVGTAGSQGRTITFNMLMDPHGSVHATCGILPVQELTLPKDLYYQALEQLEVSLLTTPLITPQQMIHLSLPEEPNFQWSWVEIDHRKWRELSTVGHFRKEDLIAEFGTAGNTLWEQLLDRGWIIMDEEQAAIVPPDRRPKSEGFPAEQLAPQLEHFLATRQIHSFQLSPSGKTGQEIREGWLKLRPMPELPNHTKENEAS